jgi:guanylate kinase
VGRLGRLFVISGPSGAGKSTCLGRLMGAVQHLCFSVSVTTRPPRPGEQDGVDYFFVNQERFEEMVAHNELLEWVHVHQHCSGTPRKFIERCTQDGIDVVLDIDAAGARKVRDFGLEATYIFLAPPSLEELERRLVGRHTENDELIRIRLAAARSELAAIPEYDYLVVNEHVGDTVLNLQSVIEAERARVARVLPMWPQLSELL